MRTRHGRACDKEAGRSRGSHAGGNANEGFERGTTERVCERPGITGGNQEHEMRTARPQVTHWKRSTRTLCHIAGWAGTSSGGRAPEGWCMGWTIPPSTNSRMDSNSAFSGGGSGGEACTAATLPHHGVSAQVSLGRSRSAWPVEAASSPEAGSSGGSGCEELVESLRRAGGVAACWKMRPYSISTRRRCVMIATPLSSTSCGTNEALKLQARCAWGPAGSVARAPTTWGPSVATVRLDLV
mmetsp:Transcript_1172/g.3253  ORF Transcript_1172/g.3253 Transcript_1172/m.3253 type:complete len:241 (-) Transcript_1172:321-1043(-)